MSRAALLLLVVAACVERPARNGSALMPADNPADSAFALVQARGHAAMGVDQYTRAIAADTLPGGGQVSLRTSDPSAVAAIHDFLAFQRQDHRSTSHGDGY